jgi:site-specific DNA-methyltransferase (cytosine-N4-specific)
MAIYMDKRVVDSSWDFRNVDTKEYTHGIHTYPAMMIPQVARRLIKLYGHDAEIIYDPFLGSGSVLVEGMLNEKTKKVYGTEINPLAILISKAKTQLISPIELEQFFDKLKNDVENDNDKKHIIPDFSNIDFWFSIDIKNELAKIKANILNLSNGVAKDFFLVAFSEIVRQVSYTKNSEFKLVRMKDDKRASHNPDVWNLFVNKVRKNIDKYISFYDALKNKNCQVEILAQDTRKKTDIPDKSVDLIVTSPPYGDSSTTVAYGQFSRLSSSWLDFDYETVKSVDRNGLGGISLKHFEHKIPSPQLVKTIEMIKQKDEKRAKQVLSFYADFELCAKEIDRVMKKGGYICMVVGNRTVKNVWIETDRIISELFSNKHDYEHITTIVREIPSKRMPKRNSPTNVQGETVPTMNNEYIVILKKN